MIRSCLLYTIILVSVISCAGSPVHTPAASYSFSHYSGSSDDSGTLNRAAAPAGVRQIKAEEARVLVARYETDMDEYLAAGNFAAALDSYNKAADITASLKQEPEYFEAIREKMQLVLSSVQVSRVSVPGDTVPGRAFNRDFSARVVSTWNGTALPLSGISCTVTYPVYLDGGSVEHTTKEIITNESGIALFSAPVPATAGKNILEITAGLPLRDPVLLSRLRQDGIDDALTVSFIHGVETIHKNIPTTISFLDYDKNGNPVLHNNQTATRLLRPLIQRGFSRIGMADFPRQLAAGDEDKLIAAARAQFGSGVQRFIYGTTRIDFLDRGEDGLWVCTLSTNLSVWDFTRNEKVYQKTITHTSTGKTEAAALETARNELAGSLLVDDLRYNL